MAGLVIFPACFSYGVDPAAGPTLLFQSMLSVFNIFRPEAFILGGGISAQGDYLINKLKAHCEKFDYGYKKAPKTEILTAKLGNDAGIIGAAALFR